MLLILHLALLLASSGINGAPVEENDNASDLKDNQIWTISDPIPIPDNIMTSLRSMYENGLIDVFRLTTQSAKFMVKSADIEQVTNLLTGLGVTFAVEVPDVSVYVKNLESKSKGSRAVSSCSTALATDAYMTFSQIEAYLDSVATNYNSLVTKTSIGKSIENRDIWMITIKSDTVPAVKSIVVDGGIHAREWISPAVTLHLIDMLVKNPDLIENIEFRIVPVVNPDGYVYTHTTNRLWRKNRRDNSGSSCMGVDLNRNWDSQFGGTGTSSSACSEIYRGNSAFSEPETKAVSDAFITATNVMLALSIHSYSQLVLYPLGYTTADYEGKDVQKQVADELSAAIKAVNGYTYTTMSGADLYPASGTTDDWNFQVLKARYAFTLELRDTGTYGFELPASQITATRQEIWAGFLYLIDKVKSECVDAKK